MPVSHHTLEVTTQGHTVFTPRVHSKYNGLCDPECGQWTQLCTPNDSALTIVRAVSQVTFFYFYCQMDCRASWCTSSLFRNGVWYCPVSSAPDHPNVSWWSWCSTLYLSYPPSWYPGMRNIPLENSHRGKTFLRKIEVE